MECTEGASALFGAAPGGRETREPGGVRLLSEENKNVVGGSTDEDVDEVAMENTEEEKGMEGVDEGEDPGLASAGNE